ncbi:MAG: helix-turn-helix transcriptional regulator, partial [Gemmatimonadaceae bacterium]
MGKIAVEVERALARRAVNGTPGGVAARVLASGDGWTVEDVICTSGPRDRPFEERHSTVGIAIVAAGTFQYRSPAGRELMTPGSLLLGNAGQCFECGHEHGTGDRCIAFHYAPDYFERLAADAGSSAAQLQFRLPRLPPLRELSALVARACTALMERARAPWEEIGILLAGQVVRLAAGMGTDRSSAPRAAVGKVTRTVRTIERHPGADFTLGGMAREAGLSPYHFLRTFERVTGVTPHRYVRRARLREAAMRLAVERAKVIEIALASGFDDVSNFNRAFRAEFGVTPRAYR